MLKKLFFYIFLLPFYLAYYVLKYLYIIGKKMVLAFLTLIGTILSFFKKKQITKKENNTNNINIIEEKPIIETNVMSAVPINPMDEVDKLDGLQFESYVAELLKKLDYKKVNITPTSGDFGIDILCEKDNIKYAIQCKNYNSVLGSKPIQEAFSGKQFYNCHIGVVITNNYFTSHAKTLANNTGILLWDRAVLNNMILKANGENTILKYVNNDDVDDPMFNEVLNFVIDKGVANASLLQRKFRLGYNRAARLIDILEEKGYISPSNGSQPRQILIKKE